MRWKGSLFSPHLGAWKAVSPPSGRWVLEEGRPRCVPERPDATLSEASVEAWSQRCRPFAEKPKTSERKLKQRAEPRSSATYDFEPAVSTESTPRASKKEADALTDKSSVYSSESDEDEEDFVAAKSDAVDGIKAYRNKRVAIKEPVENKWVVEDLNEILKPMDHHKTSAEETQKSFPRFSWMGSKNAIVSQPGAKSATRQKWQMLGTRRQSSLIGKALPPPEAAAKPEDSNTNEKVAPDAGRRGSATSVASARETVVYPTGSLSELGAIRRRQDRDQRSELRRLQQVLLTSAQQAFDSEIWESCGIEAEHLKRQQLAALLSTGLSRPVPQKNAEEEQDQTIARSFSSILKKGALAKKRVTMTLGVQFKDVKDEEEEAPEEEPEPIPLSPEQKAKITGRRKSAFVKLET
jgi:hypothetical protein